jgi:hypothetical protein
MEPISIGIVVAALIAKALDKAEDGVIDEGVKIAREAVAKLRRRFAGDAEAEEALEGVVGAPDSERRQQALASLLEARSESSPELLEELKGIVGEAKGAGVTLGPIEQVAEGDSNVQIVSVGSQVNVQPAGPRRPGA